MEHPDVVTMETKCQTLKFSKQTIKRRKAAADQTQRFKHKAADQRSIFHDRSILHGHSLIKLNERGAAAAASLWSFRCLIPGSGERTRSLTVLAGVFGHRLQQLTGHLGDRLQAAPSGHRGDTAE